MPQGVITISIRDANGKLGGPKFYMPDVVEVADVQTRVAALLATIAPITVGAIVGASYTIQQNVSLYSGAAPGAQSDIEELGRFLFRSSVGKTFRVSLPTWDESYTNAGSHSIDTNDAAVIAFVNEILSGNYVDSNGVQLVALNEAYEAYGKTRR